MFQPIIDAFGAIMSWCYSLTMSYSMAILLFTVLTRIVLLPLSVWQQKNSVKMVELQPEINAIKAQYINDSARAGEAQLRLYKKVGYKPLVGIIPLLVQIPLIVAVISVVYNPLTYLIHLDPTTLTALQECMRGFLATSDLGFSWEISAVSLLESSDFVAYAQAAGIDTAGLLDSLDSFDHSFFGLDLLLVPTFTNGLMLFPVLALVSTLALCLIQNRENVLQREQGGFGRWGTTVVMMLLALYLSFAVPAGAILYWIYGNVLAIGILYLMNVIINPKKHIDYEALENSRILLAKAEAGKKSKKEHKDELRRSKADYKRFFADDDVKKEVVFYSSAAGTHKYFKGVIEKILSESNIVIHYVTSNLKDNVFEMVDHPRFIPYYIEGTNLIYFFMKLDAVLMVMTMPEFHTYSYKRSIVQKDIEYIYLFHGVLSPNLIYKKGALDHYDTIFCTGPSQFEELRLEEEMRGIKPRKLIQGGYSLIDDTIAAYQHKAQQESGHRPEILIAPSWHEQNILDVCIDELLNAILGKGYHITLRPHPEYIRRYNHRMQALISRYQGVPAEELTFESDHSSNESVFSADVLITDWSTICFEYSFATLRPTLFIETPMKIMNPDYQELGNVPLEIRSRTDMGRSVDPENMQEVDTSIQDFLANKESYQERIQKVIDYALYNVGTSAEVEADYIISRVLSNREKRGAAK